MIKVYARGLYIPESADKSRGGGKKEASTPAEHASYIYLEVR